ncbi:GSCFA domain-containing protein [Pararhizobium sp. A13]|uniref:GSCFA domain-containing protein n=1 Tax=Pararhizobium sp. A13 TaxID=3133975 RepID=UPI0032490739
MAFYAYEQDGRQRKTSQSFFRGEHTNFHPTNNSFAAPNFLAEYLMEGWAPASKFVTKETPIVAFGSCFAANISDYLHGRDYNVLTKKESRAYVTQMGDGIVNTFAILQQFEWAWLNKTPNADLWHGYAAEEFGYDEAVRLETKDLFDQADLFIITLGLSEVWYDEPTGEVFWRAVPMDKYDPARHKFRVSSFAENAANLQAIRALIRKFRPDAHILFSVSPIPLAATFRSVSCLSADAVSKAIIRAALDEFMRANGTDERLHYMPSYEAVTRLFKNQWMADRRHIYPHVLDFNMQVFEAFYCNPGLPAEELADAFRVAVEEDVKIGIHGQEEAERSYYEMVRLRTEQRKEDRRQARIQARIDARVAERRRLRELEMSTRKASARSDT